MPATFAPRADLLPHASVLADVSECQIRAFRRLVKLGDSPAKPRGFGCSPATAEALVGAGLAVEAGGLYRSALVAEVEHEADVWFDLFHQRAYEPTAIVTVARADGRVHYLRMRVRRVGSPTAEVLPVKGFPMVNSVPMDPKRVEAEGWLVVVASDEDRHAIRAAGFGSMVPEEAVEVLEADTEDGGDLEPAPAPSPWGERPFALYSAPRMDQLDWPWSHRQGRVAAALGLAPIEPPVEPTTPEVRMVGILGRSYALRPIAIDPEIGTHAYELFDADRNQTHHVHRDLTGGIICTCGDFEFRRSRFGGFAPCKHGLRLCELGLVVAPSPGVLPPFAARAERMGVAR